MHMCKSICVYVHVCMSKHVMSRILTHRHARAHVHVHASSFLYIRFSVHLYICIRVFVYICKQYMYIFTPIFKNTCMCVLMGGKGCVCVCACVCVRMCVHVCVYIAIVWIYSCVRASLYIYIVFSHSELRRVLRPRRVCDSEMLLLSTKAPKMTAVKQKLLQKSETPSNKVSVWTMAY